MSRCFVVISGNHTVYQPIVDAAGEFRWRFVRRVDPEQHAEALKVAFDWRLEFVDDADDRNAEMAPAASSLI